MPPLVVGEGVLRDRHQSGHKSVFWAIFFCGRSVCGGEGGAGGGVVKLLLKQHSLIFRYQKRERVDCSILIESCSSLIGFYVHYTCCKNVKSFCTTVQ